MIIAIQCIVKEPRRGEMINHIIIISPLRGLACWVEFFYNHFMPSAFIDIIQSG
jgi:hypothetical protein